MPGNSVNQLKGTAILTQDQFSDPYVLLGKAISPIPVKGTITTLPTGTLPASNVPVQPVTNVFASNATIKIGPRNFAQVFVTFQRPTDPNFGGVQIWFKGYNGSPQFTLVGSGNDSPVIFLCELTGDAVTLAVVSTTPVGGVSSTPDKAPSVAMTLNGNLVAPPAPSISQSLVAVGSPTIGWQFQFNMIQVFTTNVIDGYWIYRNTVHTAPTPPAGRYKFVKHSTLAGVYTFQDITGVATSFFYWVSTIDTAGNESTLTDAGSGGGGGNTFTYRPTAASGNYGSPTNAEDGNPATSSVGFTNTHAPTKSETWSGFPAGQVSPTSVTLKVTSSATYNTSGGTVDVQYSTDNGVTFNTVYFRSATFGTTTDQISLSTGVDLTKVQVKADNTYGSGTSISHAIVDIWIEEVK